MMPKLKKAGEWKEVSEQDYEHEVNEELQRLERCAKIEQHMWNIMRQRQRRRSLREQREYYS